MSPAPQAPDPRQRVRLTIEGQGSYEGSVESVEDGRIQVSLFIEPDVDVSKLGTPEAVLEFTTARGLHRCAGVVRRTGGREELELSGWELDDPLQRRDFARADAIIPVKGWTDDGSMAFEGQTLNVSGGGFLLTGVDDLLPGDVAWFQIRPEGLPAIEARGRVVRQGHSGARGIEIELIREGSRDRLVQLVFERQRRERLVARERER